MPRIEQQQKQFFQIFHSACEFLYVNKNRTKCQLDGKISAISINETTSVFEYYEKYITVQCPMSNDFLAFIIRKQCFMQF